MALQRTVIDTSTHIAEDAVGGVIGVFGGGAVGHLSEGYLKPGVTSASSMSDKIIAWLANNGAKGIAYIGAKKVLPGGAYTRHVPTGIAISAGIDTAIRLMNGGVNNVPLSVSGVQILGMAESPERAARQRQFNAMPTGFETSADSAAFTEQRNAAKKAYGSMDIPDRYQLQRQFGAMDKAGQSQLEKMFNCL